MRLMKLQSSLVLLVAIIIGIVEQNRNHVSDLRINRPTLVLSLNVSVFGISEMCQIEL